MVKPGDAVRPFDVIGESMVSRFIKDINAAGALGISPADLGKCLLKQKSEPIFAGEELAHRKGLLGKKVIKAPFSGTLEDISDEGVLRLKSVAEKVKLLAGVSGRIAKVKKDWAVLIEANATLVKGVWAVGPESEGEIKIIASPEETIEANRIHHEAEGKILVGGSLVTRDVLKKAAVIGVKGIVCGGINYDAAEDSRVPLLITEGFGRIPMNKKIFEYLKAIEARFCLLSTDRREIVVPEAMDGILRDSGNVALWTEVEVNQAVQVFVFPYFGWEGKVVGVYEGLREMPSGIRVEAVRVRLDQTGEEIDVPARNVGVLI